MLHMEQGTQDGDGDFSPIYLGILAPVLISNMLSSSLHLAFGQYGHYSYLYFNKGFLEEDLKQKSSYNSMWQTLGTSVCTELILQQSHQ